MAKTYLEKFRKYKTRCIAAFGKCRKYEDEVGEAIQYCRLTPTKILYDLKKTEAVYSAATKVQKKLKEVANGRNPLGRSSVKQRVSYTCATFYIRVVEFNKNLSGNPKDPETAAQGEIIASATVSICTSEEKKGLFVLAEITSNLVEEIGSLIEVWQTGLEGMKSPII